MALDTRYRPRTYDDVLGQEAAVMVLRQFVKEGRGFHQSYVFCGQHGSGKTTMGRILARALLCEDPQGGDPCDRCHSCRVFLEGGTHESFEEHDAASKSKKEDLAKVIEDISYSTFSGNRRIYLFDESHRLSKQALDVLLKPMEDDIEGTEDKQLVCIFCTTDPGKMSSTIFSRCAPAFVIRAVSPEAIGERLAFVCDQEGIEYDPGVLPMIAEIEGCHIRDALKTTEGVSMLGPVTRESVSSFLQLGANDLALDILDALGTDLNRAVEVATRMSHDVSPSAAYERIAEASLCGFRAHLGVGNIPSQWDSQRIGALSDRGPNLLGICSRFAAPPHKPSRHTLILDVGAAHYALLEGTPPSEASKVVVGVSSDPRPSTEAPQAKVKGTIFPVAPKSKGKSTVDGPSKNAGGVWVDPKAVGRGPVGTSDSDEGQPSQALDPDLFRKLVRHHLRGLTRGSQGRS